MFENEVKEDVWVEGMQEKYNNLILNDVWGVVPTSEGKLVFASKWLYIR